jgi:hypothetical protein
MHGTEQKPLSSRRQIFTTGSTNMAILFMKPSSFQTEQVSLPISVLGLWPWLAAVGNTFTHTTTTPVSYTRLDCYMHSNEIFCVEQNDSVAKCTGNFLSWFLLFADTVLVFLFHCLLEMYPHMTGVGQARLQQHVIREFSCPAQRRNEVLICWVQVFKCPTGECMQVRSETQSLFAWEIV